MKNAQRLNLERICFAFAFGISNDKDAECLLKLFQIKFFDDVSNYEYFINQVLPVFEMNYNEISIKKELLKDIEKEIKVYLITTCIKYIDSTDLLKGNQTEYNKFQICLKILQQITNKRLNYGERLFKKINGSNNDVTKGVGNNNNIIESEDIIYNDDNY